MQQLHPKGIKPSSWQIVEPSVKSSTDRAPLVLADYRGDGPSAQPPATGNLGGSLDG